MVMEKRPPLTTGAAIGKNDTKFREIVSLVGSWLEEAAEQHSSGRIEVQISLRDGYVTRAEATPLARVIQ
jgi:hypothetical protein